MSRNRINTTLSRTVFRPGRCLHAAAVALAACVLAFPAAGFAQSVRAGSGSGQPGATVGIPISFSAGATGVASLQFDVTFSNSFAVASVSTGSAAGAAGKSATANPFAGGVTVLIYGTNINVIASGSLATVQLNIAAGAPVGTATIGVTNVVASDPNGNQVNVSAGNGSITVLASAGTTDTTPPAISGVGASGVSQTGATIRWTTNEPADSQIEYGTSTYYGHSSALNTSKVTSHSQSLSGLTAGTLYHYRVKSRDAAGNLAVSGDYTITTTNTKDTTPPTISGVSATAGSTSATVQWETNEAADSQVEYGTTTAYGRASNRDSSQVTSHAIALTGLTAETTYHYRVKSADADGNLAVSGDYTFKTGKASEEETAITLIYPRPLMRRLGEPGGADEDLIGMALVNLGSTRANVTFTAYRPDGTMVRGSDVTNPATRELLPGQQFPIVDSDPKLFGEGFMQQGADGWIKIDSDVSGVTGFFLMFDSDLSVLDGAVASKDPMTSFVFPEIEDQGFTRLSITNPDEAPAIVTMTLRRADGEALQATRTINARSSFVADVTDVFPDAAPGGGDYVRVIANHGVLAFELMGKTGQYVEGLNGLDDLQGGTTLYCPQYAVGGGWRTTLSVVNLDGSAGTVTFQFVPQDAPELGSTKTVSIPAHGKIHITDQDFFDQAVNSSGLVQGYVKITTDGVNIAGNVVFGDSSQSNYASALPLVAKLENSVVFSQVASDDVYYTGLAIFNPNDADAAVTIDVCGINGVVVGSKTLPIRAHQRLSKVLKSYFPELAGRQISNGYIRVMSDVGVASFELFGTHDLKALSAVPPQVVQ